MIKDKIRNRLQVLLRESALPLNLFIRKASRIDPDKIAFYTITSKFTCNPKYISEKIRALYPDIRIVWLTSEKEEDQKTFPDYVKRVPAFSLEGMREAYTSKIWIDNGLAFTAGFIRKDDQIHIQTMHGSLGIKRLDNAILMRQKKFLGRRDIYRESNLTDYVITNSKFEEDVFRSVFWKNVPMMRLGHARTDILFSQNEPQRRIIREKLFKTYGIPVSDKLVLYAPTHRKDNVMDLNYGLLKEALEKRFGGVFSVIIKLHPKAREKRPAIPAFVRDLSDYADIQELMLVCDVGVTDYSSWIFDYVLTKKPGFIFAPDVERYNTVTKFCYPLEETPFMIGKTNNELSDCIAQFNQDDYEKKVDAFLEEKGCVDDGNAAERIAVWVRSLMHNSH
ncbi:MAG: CDP-glycerol glycerophosphotransferase family protein [Erysipelotrichaceae bacterium]|nr:CDP-glycerol glycerophosphotransferase family protein [Erysipelotrichaceae bacterium]